MKTDEVVEMISMISSGELTYEMATDIYKRVEQEVRRNVAREMNSYATSIANSYWECSEIDPYVEGIMRGLTMAKERLWSGSE